ncbi:MAG: succinate dehydrogenase, hydrophobic membrane anchor protein [Betaproteobacteria bacterium]|jgi:succinate dehydrogenase / fumarate reductase membrane anchor subunit
MTTQRIVTGAHYGLKDWLAQRITAVVLAVYTIILGVSVLLGPPLGADTWKALFSGPFMKVLTLLAFVALAWHAWIGVRDIYMDYIKPTAVRLTLQVVTIVVLFAYVIWAANILWSI